METGKYQGIGELHLIGGFAPHWWSPVSAGLAQKLRLDNALKFFAATPDSK